MTNAILRPCRALMFTTLITGGHSLFAASDTVGIARGARRLTDIAAIPVYDAGASIRYAGSIAAGGGNDDWDWGEVQDENGEWILMEDDGPGCIYNFTQHRGETVEVPTFRFYFDGAAKPQYEITPKEFGVKPPFLAPLAGAFCATGQKRPFRIVRSFIPMEYRKSVKVTSTVKLRGDAPAGGWGHVFWHRYDSPEGLFSAGAVCEAKALADLYAKPLSLAHDDERKTASAALDPGGSVEIYSAGAANTLVGIDCAVIGFSPTHLANLWIVLTFDGRTTCRAPFGTFFGCETPGRSAKLQTALLTFDTSDSAAARFENRFPMPFFRSASVRIENRGSSPVRLGGATVRSNGKLRYDPSLTGIFSATEYLPKTRNRLHQNAHIGLFAGRGQMAYGVISGYDFDNKKYGWGVCEGDVRCFIDDMTVPRVQSDGSESWGSWGWGFCAPPQVNPFSAYHSPNGELLWSELRLTFADSYPFRRFLRFDLEHGAANDHPESSSSGQCFGYLLRSMSQVRTAVPSFSSRAEARE